MTKTRKALLNSILSLVLCFSMLLGTTYAWFTDSVTSANNIIQSGRLKAQMEYSDDLSETGWKDASTGAIFDYQHWEPGFTQVKYIKVKNTGNLAFKYLLNIAPDGAVTKLAEVIDVYCIETSDKIDARTGLTADKRVGTLFEIINGKTISTGALLPEGKTDENNTPSGAVTLALAMKMREDAGNEYQGMSLSANPEGHPTTFAVKLLATQNTYESDSFDDQYDAESKWPGLDLPEGGVNVSTGVTVDGNGKLTAEATMTKGEVSATVPAGVAVNAGTAALTLSVSEKKNSESNVTTGTNEELMALDVHIEGVSADNTTPITVKLGKALPVGLNLGNVSLYHVENGSTNKMERVMSLSDLDEHNEFYYDPATGEVTVAMATFSEIALLADTENAWEGEFDYSWYTNAVAPLDGEATADYVIANADQLAAFGAIVGGMDGQTQDSFSGKTVKLIADVNLGYGESETYHIFYPIGYYNDAYSYEKVSGGSVTSGTNSFEGTFDGNGHTISNFYQNTWEMFGDYNDGYSGTPNHYKDAMGLFGYVNGGTVKNLTVDNFSSDGEFTPTGVIAAYAVNSTFENIAITNCNPRVYNTGNGGIVGIGGNSDDPDTDKLTFTNITIDNTNKITALWGSWDVACGGLVGMFRGAGHVYMTNCHVAAQIDVYNDVCGNYQYYWYRYSGMMVGTNKNMKTENGYTVPETDKFHAENCTVHFGDWNDYYYCELVANSLASYTHDHQFSRLEQISSLDEIKSGDTWTKAGNFLLISGDTKTCYHIVNKNGALTQHLHTDAGYEDSIDEDGDGKVDLKEDKQIVYLPFNQLFTGYGWGVKHIPVYNGEDYAFDGITILDREVADSAVKFETKFTGDFLYRVGNGNAVSIGSLFAAKDGAEINSSGVWVTVEKVDKNMNVSGTFNNENKDSKVDWTTATLDFDGTGVVKVTIQDYNFCKPTELYLEVVDAKNSTTASFSGNTVLLNDVSASSTLGASGVVYGNGFTVNMENAPISEKNGAVFHLYDGAVLKNLAIVGKEFTTVAMNVNDTNYGVSAVRAWGTVTIENCYISGCRSAVSVTGTELTIKDSVIANGVYANVDFRSGILNLNNVTTINEPHAVNGTTIVGLGIVGNMTASAGRQLNVTGTLTQYNWVSKADCSSIKASGVDGIFNSVFTDSKYASLRYTYGGTTYVNTGILSLCSDFGASAVTGVPSNYGGMDVTATISNVSVDGYVWAPNQTGTLTADDMKYHDTVYSWTSSDQGTSYIPSAFDFTNAGLTAENGVVQIEYESGSFYALTGDTVKKLFSATKYGKDLNYRVSMNSTDYTDKDIVFDDEASETYTITYTITDNLVYDKNGTLTENTYEITKDLNVFATVVDKGADAPTFTFYYGTNGSASAGTPHTTQPTNSYTSTIKQVGEAYYIMPNVSATTANAIGSQTVDGVTVYYPIVDGINVRSGNSMDYDFTRYYPVFKAVKISDNGTEYSYSGTKEMPATVAWVSATIDSGNGASALNDGFGLYNNQYLCKIQKKAGDAENGGTSVVKYSYTALDGNTYCYYVGYRFYNEDEGGGCFTPDTLVTLADGSQKRVDELSASDKILAWDFFIGNYAEKNISLLVNHGEAFYRIANLQFSDRTELRIIGDHGIFDYDLNKFVYITVDNMEDYIGHRFVQHDEGGYNLVTLNSAYETEEYTSAWSITSAGTSNAFASGLLTVAPPEDFYNWIEMEGKLRYDAEQFAKDVETYGLYTYEDFADYVTYEQFIDWNGAYLKIAVEKGYFTFDYILELIELYKGWMPNN